ncbi:MAG: TetR/AcrR family transcriptional regulator [Gemmatimonadota bacterium]
MPGRRGQAARNDSLILRAAREVFLADPKAPIAAVAERAGVGISALYRRYPGKEDLLRRLCHDGLLEFIALAEAAGGERDPWQALCRFLRAVVDADVHSLTVHLAGTFAPTPQMEADAVRANELALALLGRARSAGRVRPDFADGDLTLLLEACAAIRVPDPERTRELRRRQLALIQAGMLASGGPELQGPPPTPIEVNWRWRR